MNKSLRQFEALEESHGQVLGNKKIFTYKLTIGGAQNSVIYRLIAFAQL